ncbi:hypothetical protein HGRIS_014285 [Hohenbuehelia grisea]|uniref:Phospholipid/glycerol acyltransferase domain-containing protein n=1 Tax=Hohenbuehelia grisea TaxID=104357 RepID=A0ABR3JUP6_9AGAR
MPVTSVGDRPTTIEYAYRSPSLSSLVDPSKPLLRAHSHSYCPDIRATMDLPLVYRILRSLSDVIVRRYYSELHVQGPENVPYEAPLIIAASHHNEIIDIASLAMSIPHGRHLAFWAKSTMFANLILRNVLLSSGAIPVQRNPNSFSSQSATNSSTDHRTNGKADLFYDSALSLAKGRVLGVFPEGTSYTEPRILQILPGAAWAAVDYATRWGRFGPYANRDSQWLRSECVYIVPTGIVYTDKASYRSRIVVHYGSPIDVDACIQAIMSSDVYNGLPSMQHAVAKALVAAMESELLQLTLNAPDWDTWYAARMACELAGTMPLKDFAPTFQRYIRILSTTTHDGQLDSSRRSFLRYYALLHHTGIDHGALSAILSHRQDTYFALNTANMLYILLRETIIAILHPQFIFFLPQLAVHFPAYVAGALAGRYIAPRSRSSVQRTSGEETQPNEEAQAQYKAVFGGVTAGAVYVGVAWRLGRALFTLSRATAPNIVIGRIGGLLAGHEGASRRLVAMIGVVWGTSWVCSRWHDALIDSNYSQ